MRLLFRILLNHIFLFFCLIGAACWGCSTVKIWGFVNFLFQLPWDWVEPNVEEKILILTQAHFLFVISVTLFMRVQQIYVSNITQYFCISEFLYAWNFVIVVDPSIIYVFLCSSQLFLQIHSHCSTWRRMALIKGDYLQMPPHVPLHLRF